MYQTSREEEKTKLWGMSTVTVTMCHDMISRKHSGNDACPAVAARRAIPEGRGQLQWGRRSECGGWALLCEAIKLKSSSPFVRREAGGAVRADHSRDQECLWGAWLDRCGQTGDEGYIRSPTPSPVSRAEVACPKWALTLFQKTTTTNQRSLWEILKFVWLGNEKAERIINDSNLVVAFSHHISFIHTSYSDEQCITQKYKGKILVLHYTFSKIYTE